MEGVAELSWGLLTPLIVAAVAGLGGLVKVGFDALGKRIDRRLNSDIRAGYRAIERTFGIMDLLLNETPANRVLLLKSENGGGIPGPGNVAYSTVVRERRDDRISSVQARWQRVPVDKDYARMICDIIDTGRVERHTSEMVEGSELRDVYEADGVKFSTVSHLCTTKDPGGEGGAVYYVSINFVREGDKLDPNHRSLLNQGIRDLGDLMSEHHHIIDRPDTTT